MSNYIRARRLSKEQYHIVRQFNEAEMAELNQRIQQLQLADWRQRQADYQASLADFDARIASAGHGTAAAFSHGAALRVWASARVPGFAEALGNGHLANTGVIIAEGDPHTGWSFAEMTGLMHYGEDPSALDIEQDSAS